MRTRQIGSVRVSAIGFGAMHLSTEGRPESAQAIRTLHAALDAGVTVIDTADAYCLDASETGHNERLVAAALNERGASAREVLVATKGGHYRSDDGTWKVDGRPERLKAACEASLRALQVDVVGLYQFHRPDPQVAFAESVGALKELQEAGKIRMAGLSNVSVEQIDQARRILDVASVQNQFSPDFRSSEGELSRCAELGIAFLPWGTLGRAGAARELGARHPGFAAVAAERGVSPQRVALAWALGKASVVVPIPGARRVASILDSVAAADLVLTDEEMERLDRG
jgi:aryl-alcohol dehydrogenase-like predicted oxidoreductase